MIDDNDPWNSKKYDNNPKNSKNEDDINLIFIKINKFFNSFFNKGNNLNNPSSNKKFIIFICVFILSLYLCNGFHVIHPDEEGVKLVFGKYSGTVGPGLRYHPPIPIGKLIKVKVKTVNREEIGSRLYTENSIDHGEGVMLTGDENIVNINFDVQWRVSDAYNFLFKVRDYMPGLTVKNAAESAMREIIGKSTISFAIEGKGRAMIAHETKALLQNILDHYQMGVEVLSIQLKKVDPPEKVISAFRDVQSARADKEKVINEALAYRNEVIPKAKGEAIRIKLDAEAYYSETVNSADGNSKRFLSIHNEYKDQPSAVRNRLYLETMEDILHRTDKVIVSDDIKGLFSYLPLANINQK